MGIASKMAMTLLAGVYIGLQLDKWLAWKIPVFTLVFTIVAATLSIYIIIKEFA
jgi:F0F1-type ATP synthase assembly protein I